MLIQNVSGNPVPAPAASNGSSGTPVSAVPTPPVGNAGLTQNGALPVVGTPAAQPSNTQLQSALDKINQTMLQTNTGVEFSIDSNSKATLIKVVDTQTGQMIKQIPSKEVIAVSEAIGQYQQGLLVKQKA